jgi:NAD(P)-dependent dehydrogenase (short-subunit alcohol dehydrogenase family)
MDLGLAGRACVVAGAADELGRETARLLRAEGARVTEPGADPSAAELAGVDVLVCNPGEPAADPRAAFELAVMGPMRAMRTLAPALAERGWGRIVTVCPTPRSPAGAASLALTRLFADHHAKAGVLVNAVCPEPGAAPAVSAAEIVFLCSERASHVAGATWTGATGHAVAGTAGGID